MSFGKKKEESPQVQPAYSVPAQPSIVDLANQYGEALPKIISLMQQYGPQFDAYNLKALQDYGPQYAQASYDIENQLYPYSTGLQEQLAKQASEGVSSTLPASLQSAYLDQLRAEVGANVGSPISGDYVSRNLLNQAEQYKNYYQNLGLSLTGRVPISYGQNYSASNAGLGGFGLPQAAAYSQGTYGQYLDNLGKAYQLGAQYLPFRGESSGGSGGSGALGGALKGASYGSFAGPWGTLIGGGIGAFGGSRGWF